MTVRVGLVGYGYIGAYLYEQIRCHPEWGLEIAFVAATSARGKIPDALILDNLSSADKEKPDLIVEAAHPDVSVKYVHQFLTFSSYMPLSLSAIADAAVEQTLLTTAVRNGTRLYIPHGAAVGLETIFECRDIWESVTVTMKKNPVNLDFSASLDTDHRAITKRTTLHDGSAREACRRFPRNVNAHAAVSLAGIGFDRTRSILIADPSLDVSIIEIEAAGGGLHMRLERSNPLQGVSGILTLRSILGSVQRTFASGYAVQIC